ncbi:MAG: ABC transporter permease [Bradymonadaceae bacterium]
MTRYIIRRILSSIFVLFVIVTASLWITRQAPSNPCLKEKQVNTCACLKKYKLDRPVFPIHTPPPIRPVEGCQFWDPSSSWQIGPVEVIGPSDWGGTQFANYMSLLASGSLGPSMRTGRPVIEALKSGLPYTLQLGLQAMILALLIGVPAGMFAGVNQNTLADYSTMTIAMIGIAVPNIVLGPMLIATFALDLGWFDPGGWESWSDSVLPSITLSLYYAAYIARLARGGMLEMIRKDFVRTARAKGLTEGTIVFRHTFKGTILPVVSYLGPAFAAMITGSVVVEEIFNLPGIGTRFVRSALNRDYNMVLGAMIVYSTFLVTLNFLVDILYTYIDPRVDYDERA